MRQNKRHGYFVFDGTQMGEMVTWLAQYRDTTCWGWNLLLSLFFTQRTQTATESLPTFNRHYGQLCRSCIPNFLCDHFKQMHCAATDKI